jgi:predicted esterase
MASYKVEQRRLWHRGRTFHFVSYAGRPANEDRGEPAVTDMWFLMSEGKRHPVIPQVKGQETAELDQALLAWLDEYVFTRAVGDHAHGGV